MIRKRIGSSYSNVTSDDDINDDAADLEELLSIGESSSSDDERRDILALRAFEARDKHSDLDVDNKSHDLECTCDVCMKSFFRNPDEINIVCPYCGHKFQIEDLEEIDMMQDNPYKETVFSNERSVERQKRFQNLFQHRPETWEDGRKEQISLELGSDEYGEYVDDLSRNNPKNPDDTFHQNLERHNENLVTKQYDVPQENPEAAKSYEKSGETSISIQKREEMQKRSLHAAAVREAIAAAALTPSLTDDQLAHAITTDNEVLYNSGIKPDEYVEALKDYVVEPSL